uniref:Uncharacterized protein n=1 Tax=Steinernema glaseri TaxID=37863 RepID=A0A1I8AMC4_9BILA
MCFRGDLIGEEDRRDNTQSRGGSPPRSRHAPDSWTLLGLLDARARANDGFRDRRRPNELVNVKPNVFAGDLWPLFRSSQLGFNEIVDVSRRKLCLPHTRPSAPGTVRRKFRIYAFGGDLSSVLGQRRCWRTEKTAREGVLDPLLLGFGWWSM